MHKYLFISLVIFSQIAICCQAKVMADEATRLQVAVEQGLRQPVVFENEAVLLFTKELQLSLEIPHPENIQFYHIQAMVQDILKRSGHPSTGKTALKASWMMEQILKS